MLPDPSTHGTAKKEKVPRHVRRTSPPHGTADKPASLATADKRDNEAPGNNGVVEPQMNADERG